MVPSATATAGSGRVGAAAARMRATKAGAGEEPGQVGFTRR